MVRLLRGIIGIVCIAVVLFQSRNGKALTKSDDTNYNFMFQFRNGKALTTVNPLFL